MRIDFNQIQEMTMPCGYEGTGEMLSLIHISEPTRH